MKANIERLTERIDGIAMPKFKLYEECEVYGTREGFSRLIGKLSDRLAELEDKLNQGMLIEPPCNVGDIVYVNKKTLCDWYTFLEFKKYVKAEVIGIKITKKQKLVNLKPLTERNHNTRYHEFYPFSAFGKTVFLTESEAKAELERRSHEPESN